MNDLIDWLAVGVSLIGLFVGIGIYFNVGRLKHAYMPRRHPRKASK